MNLDPGDLGSKAGSIVKDNAELAFLLGFGYGVTGKDVTYAKSQSYWNGYKMEEKAQVILDSFVARITGYNPFPKYANYPQTFNLGAVVNKGTIAALGVAILKELWPTKWTRLANDLSFAPLLGYGVGRIFDDPISGSTYSTGQGSSEDQGQAARRYNMALEGRVA